MKKEFKVGDNVIIESKVLKVDDTDRTLKIETNVNYGNVWFNQDLAKHAEKPFEAREMLVWDNNEQEATKKIVIDMYKGQYVVKEHGSYYTYQNAKEIPKEFENGKVYKLTKGGAIAYYTGDNNGFGFDIDGRYGSHIYMMNSSNWQEYPLEDFKKLLISEAEKRGFKSGVWVDRKEFNSKYNKRIIQIESNGYLFVKATNHFSLELGGNVIFNNGIWAKIID